MAINQLFAPPPIPRRALEATLKVPFSNRERLG